MSSKSRRFEILLPLKFNDGSTVPRDWFAEAAKELAVQFGAASYETQKIQGQWRHGGVVYHDTLIKIVIDLPDTAENRRWMKSYRDRWKIRLKQIELWLVSYLIVIE